MNIQLNVSIWISFFPLLKNAVRSTVSTIGKNHFCSLATKIFFELNSILLKTKFFMQAKFSCLYLFSLLVIKMKIGMKRSLAQQLSASSYPHQKHLSCSHKHFSKYGKISHTSAKLKMKYKAILQCSVS